MNMKNKLMEDTGCEKCGKKPSKLYAVHPLNPIKMIIRRCKLHNPFNNNANELEDAPK